MNVLVDGKSIPVGDDPTYDYVADYRKSRLFRFQSVDCAKCHKPMVPRGRKLSPMYGTTAEMFACDCGACVIVSPKVPATKAGGKNALPKTNPPR